MAWPFGYGLTYTTFEYQNLQVNSEAQTSDDYVELTFQVKNTGEVKADEIAQIYLSPADDNQNIRPIQLQGFARVSLEPGQTKTVTTRLYVEQLGFYSHQGNVRQWNIEPGTYTVKVGASSADIRLQQQLILRGTATSKPLRDHYFSESIVSLLFVFITHSAKNHPLFLCVRSLHRLSEKPLSSSGGACSFRERRACSGKDKQDFVAKSTTTTTTM